MASSLVGEPRATADVDFAILLHDERMSALVAALSPEFYVSEEAARSAVRRHASFDRCTSRAS